MKRLFCETVQNKFETLRDQSSTAKMARDNDKYVEKGKETLRTKNESKRTSITTFKDVDVKSKVRDPERLTSYNKDIASARPDVCEAHGKCKGGGAPNTNNDRTLTHPKSGFSKRETAVMYGDRNSQYGGNKSRQLDSNHDDEVKTRKTQKQYFLGVEKVWP